MDEFVENFQEFRIWLNNLPAITLDEGKLLEKIRNKFENLGLNDAF